MRTFHSWDISYRVTQSAPSVIKVTQSVPWFVSWFSRQKSDLSLSRLKDGSLKTKEHQLFRNQRNTTFSSRSINRKRGSLSRNKSSWKCFIRLFNRSITSRQEQRPRKENQSDPISFFDRWRQVSVENNPQNRKKAVSLCFRVILCPKGLRLC